MTAPRFVLLRPIAAAVLLAVCLPAPTVAQRGAVTEVTPSQLGALIAQQRGRIVIVNFWATWCPPCRTEFPDIVAVHSDFQARGVDVIAVSMNAADETGDIDGFLQKFRPPFRVYRAADPHDEFYQGVNAEWFGELPATLIVDPAGNTVHFHKKPVTRDELAADVLALLPGA
jgi:thiol-disulfide isomerase/thioredoxin